MILLLELLLCNINWNGRKMESSKENSRKKNASLLKLVWIKRISNVCNVYWFNQFNVFMHLRETEQNSNIPYFDKIEKKEKHNVF